MIDTLDTTGIHFSEDFLRTAILQIRSQFIREIIAGTINKKCIHHYSPRVVLIIVHAQTVVHQMLNFFDSGNNNKAREIAC